MEQELPLGQSECPSPQRWTQSIQSFPGAVMPSKSWHDCSGGQTDCWQLRPYTLTQADTPSS
jgi:hypothetical protein